MIYLAQGILSFDYYNNVNSKALILIKNRTSKELFIFLCCKKVHHLFFAKQNNRRKLKNGKVSLSLVIIH